MEKIYSFEICLKRGSVKSTLRKILCFIRKISLLGRLEGTILTKVIPVLNGIQEILFYGDCYSVWLLKKKVPFLMMMV